MPPSADVSIKASKITPIPLNLEKDSSEPGDWAKTYIENLHEFEVPNVVVYPEEMANMENMEMTEGCKKWHLTDFAQSDVKDMLKLFHNSIMERMFLAWDRVSTVARANCVPTEMTVS